MQVIGNGTGSAAAWKQDESVRLPPARVNILGVGVSAISREQSISCSLDLIESPGHGYVCVTGVHGIIEAQDDENFRAILNQSFLTTPDGMPTVWLGHAEGFRHMTRVYGPDYMLDLCASGVARGYRHFLYGGKEGVAEQLAQHLAARLPGIQIAGTYTPPFRPLTEEEELQLEQMLAQTRADVLWIGLSTPKQERFMAAHAGKLPVKLMVGVGAAFDLLSGNLDEAPDWMKRSGLQWLYRLVKEPRRLWRRYLINNPRFIYLVFLQWTKMRSYKLGA